MTGDAPRMIRPPTELFEVQEADLDVLKRALTHWYRIQEWNLLCLHATRAERELAKADMDAVSRIIGGVE